MTEASVSFHSDMPKVEITAPKKICLVCPSLKAGGMEHVIVQLSNYLATDPEIEVHLILLASREVFFSVARNVRVEFSVADLRQKRFSLVYRIIALRRALKNIRPNVVLSVGSMYNSFLLLASIGLNLKVYVSDRSNPYRNTRLTFKRDPIVRHDGPLHYFLKKWLYKKAAGVLVQTERARSIEQQFLGHPNIVLFPNPVKPVFVPRTIARERVIFNVGRFVKSKNQIELIEIFAEIRPGGWRLVFIGDGPTRALAETRAQELNLGNSISFLGSRRDVCKYLSKGEVFAFTSLTEGFPNALLEGMASGLACIAYDCVAGPNELIEDGSNGFLVALGQRNTYARRLRRLLSDTELRESFRERGLKSISRFEESRVFCELKRELLKA